MLGLHGRANKQPIGGMTADQYYDYIGLAILDVATANSSKGLMGLAELIVEVVRLLPELKSVSYNDVIEAVNRVFSARIDTRHPNAQGRSQGR